MKRDLPTRNEVKMKNCPYCKENDWRFLLIGFGATFVAGIIKVALMDRFSGHTAEDDLM